MRLAMNRTTTNALLVARPIILGLTVANVLYAAGLASFFVASFVIEGWPGRNVGFTPVTTHQHAPAGLRAIIVIGVIVLAIVHTILRRLLAIVDSVRGGHPFILQNAQRLAAIAWGVLAIELLRLMTIVIAQVVAIPGKGSGFTPASWLAVLLLFVLAGVFAHGARMRTDLEGTV